MFSQFGRGIDVVFANEDEIRALYPGSTEGYEALTRKLAAAGVTAAVKLGRDGSWIAKGDEIHRISPIVLSDVVDTNGAGDAWAAGFLFGYLRGFPLGKCGAIASIMGAETVRHLGPLVPDSAWDAVMKQALA